MNILLTLSYDGTNYCGWQLQQNGDSIQARLEDALSKIYGTKISVLGASRTDAGVHAIGQRAHFRVESAVNIPLEKLPQVINNRLPADIAVTYAEQVGDNFHPIACTKRKTYEYRILNRKYPDPKRGRFAYHVYAPLDFEKMRKAALYFLGTHDFTAFASAGGQVKTNVRTIYAVELMKQGDEIVFYITGSGFLYHMVRIITGTLVAVGLGYIESDKIPEIIESKSRDKSAKTAPACGLTLIEVIY